MYFELSTLHIWLVVLIHPQRHGLAQIFRGRPRIKVLLTEDTARGP